MGLLEKIESLLGGRKKDFNILVIGLDNSGKSTILNNLKTKDTKVATINPTVGFNQEKINFQSVNFNFFDMSGQSRYRSLWEHYYKESNAIIFVIDSSDRMRFVVSNEELADVVNHAEIKNKDIPLLILANKKDVKGAASENEIKNELEINRIKGRNCKVYSTNGLSGEGINEALEWLASEMKNLA
ncbi:unnamed protein product [Brachionus calyciflorus]|uniref:ADP-ribosylation factor-like protein 6 n=1 Tax=Brachionus calyciflorus TaxID=104777 RepID=A0A813PPC4_9BILA|nr:unnamed protein product [Brachionus calyciflorus]